MKRLILICATLATFAVLGFTTSASQASDFGIYAGRGYGGYHVDFSRPHYQTTYYSPFYGGYGGYYHNNYYDGYPRWHDTSHYDYHPGEFVRHRNHYHYVPGHSHLHRDGHWD